MITGTEKELGALLAAACGGPPEEWTKIAKALIDHIVAKGEVVTPQGPGKIK